MARGKVLNPRPNALYWTEKPANGKAYLHGNRRLYLDDSRLFHVLMERLFRAAGVDQADGVFH